MNHMGEILFGVGLGLNAVMAVFNLRSANRNVENAEKNLESCRRNGELLDKLDTYRKERDALHQEITDKLDRIFTKPSP